MLTSADCGPQLEKCNMPAENKVNDYDNVKTKQKQTNKQTTRRNNILFKETKKSCKNV